jgi:hypothetical protein
MLGAEKRAEARVEWKEEEATFASRRRLVADKGRWKSAHMGRQVHVGRRSPMVYGHHPLCHAHAGGDWCFRLSGGSD